MARQYSVIPDLELPIELGTSGLAAEDPITIGQMLRTTRDSYPDTPALASKEGDEWKKINYKEYYTLSLRAAKSLLKVMTFTLTRAFTSCLFAMQKMAAFYCLYFSNIHSLKFMIMIHAISRISSVFS